MSLNFFVLMPMLLILPFTHALALTDWQEVGNGGQVLVCSNGVTMYDYSEAQLRYRLKPKMPEAKVVFPVNPHIPEENRLALELLKRFRGTDVAWYGKAEGLILHFYSEANLIPGVELVVIRDTGMGFVPRGCKLEQLIAQSPPSVPEERFYKINADIWDWMFPEQRATAILHEVLYRLSPKAKFIYSSEKIRYVVGLILADALKDKSAEEVRSILLEAGLLY